MAQAASDLRQHSKENRKLAQEATDLGVIKRLLEIADDLDAEAERQERINSDS